MICNSLFRDHVEDILPFSIENLIKCLMNETSRKVVFLLTSSINYNFGITQREFFGGVLRKFFPSIVQDVLSVGHCLYGCKVCKLTFSLVSLRASLVESENTKFLSTLHDSLPINSLIIQKVFLLLAHNCTDVRALLDKQKQARKITSSPSTVLIAPSVGMLSYLFNPSIIQALITASKKLNLLFMVKLHGFCYLENHPLSGITPVEKQNVELLKQNFPFFDESQYNILPMLSEFDVVK